MLKFSSKFSKSEKQCQRCITYGTYHPITLMHETHGHGYSADPKCEFVSRGKIKKGVIHPLSKAEKQGLRQSTGSYWEAEYPDKTYKFRM